MVIIVIQMYLCASASSKVLVPVQRLAMRVIDVTLSLLAHKDHLLRRTQENATCLDQAR